MGASNVLLGCSQISAHLLVWPHGTPFLSKILDRIHSDPYLEVAHIYRQKNPSMGRLVKSVYRNDTAPRHHLTSKLAYLKEVSGDVFHVFLRVSDPQMEIVGSLRTRHIQSRRVSNLKKEVRSQMNPRLASGVVSEHHVVHASDAPHQAEQLARELGLPVGESFFRNRIGGFWAPAHLSAFDEVTYRFVPIESLLANVWVSGSLLKTQVRDTPHYKALETGNFEVYEDYLSDKFGTSMRDGQSLFGLRQILRKVEDEGAGGLPPVYVTPIAPNRYQILDGVHRVAALASAGIWTVFAGLIEDD